MHRWLPPSILALALSAAGAWAHHSLSGYDHGQQVTVEGVVSEFRFTQPHPFLIIQAGPEETSWRLEMDNLFELSDIGVSAQTFRRGDRVVVRGSQHRSELQALYLWRLDRPADGLRYEQVGSSPKIARVKP